MSILKDFWNRNSQTENRPVEARRLDYQLKKPFWNGLGKAALIGVAITATMLMFTPNVATAGVAGLSKTTTPSGQMTVPVGEKTRTPGKNYEALKQLEESGVSDSLVKNPSAPAYDPALWSKKHLAELPDKPFHPDEVGPNCYSYAVNAPHIGDPGGSVANSLLPLDADPRIDNAEEFEKRNKRVIAGATFDGLEYVGSSAKQESGKYLIAYLQMPPVEGCEEEGVGIRDFHFVRQNPDGTWSHKPGQREVTNMDADDKIITDPETARFTAGGRQYQFVGYFLVPEGGIAPNGKLRPDTGVNKLRKLDGPDDELKSGESKIARFVADCDPAKFVYLRKEDDKWVDPSGYMAPDNRDSNGKEITDPAKAYIKTSGGITYLFNGYFAAPNGDASKPPACPTKTLWQANHSSELGL